MRGLLDWKVIVALLVALAIAYAVFGGTGDLRQSLESAFGKAKSLAGGVDIPIPGLGGSAVPARVLFHSPVALSPDAPVDIQLGDVKLYQFTGTITPDLANRTIAIQPAGSSLGVRAPLTNVTISGFSMRSLSVSSADFIILPNTTASNASIELRGFRGTVTIDITGTLLDGNVTSLRTTIGGREWELK